MFGFGGFDMVPQAFATTTAGGSSAAQWDSSAMSADITLSNGNRTAAENAGTIGAVYATKSLPAASLCYWETVLDAPTAMPGLANVTAKTAPGYTTWWWSAATSNSVVLFPANASLQTNNTSYGLIGGAVPPASAVVGWYVDTTNHKLYVEVNNSAAYGNVVAGTGGLDISGLGSALFPTFQGSSGQVTAHFAAAEFVYAPKAGYAAF